MGRVGRPRLPGSREPNGRLVRRSPKRDEAFWARVRWKDYCDSIGWHRSMSARNADELMVARPLIMPIHPLLRLVESKKFDARSFAIALYWTATSRTTNPNWTQRKYLTKKTGFDFSSPKGCAAARQFAVDNLGHTSIELLDRAVFHCDVAIDVDLLADTLNRAWRAWCEHGALGAPRLTQGEPRRSQ
jgi:hypothetical protein